MAIKKLALLSWTPATGQGHGEGHDTHLAAPQSCVSSTRCQKSRDSVSVMAQDMAKQVGSPSSFSLSWCQEDAPNVLDAGNYVFILGLLRYHHLHYHLDGCPGEFAQCRTNRNGFCIGSLAARVGSNCPPTCKGEPSASIILWRKRPVLSPRRRDYRLEGRGTEG